MIEKTAKEVFEESAEKGLYEEANLDKDEAEKILKLTIEDYRYGAGLKTGNNQNWRVIFNIHYDVLRELCSLLMRFKRQKTSNHQAMFAFVFLNFPELDLNWEFFETVRKTRNQNKYLGIDISREMWKRIEFQMDFYISVISKEIENKLKHF